MIKKLEEGAVELYLKDAQGDMIDEYERDVRNAALQFLNEIEMEKEVERIKEE